MFTRYHCSECTDFDLCIPCWEKIGHQHTMKKLGLGIMIDQPSIKQEGKFMLYMSISVLLEFLNSLDNVCDTNHIHLLYVKFIFMIDS